MFRATFFLALLALVFVVVFSAGFTILQHLQGLSPPQPDKYAPHRADISRPNTDVISNPHFGAKPISPRAEKPKASAASAAQP